jgi:hypothetical protein
LPSAEGMSFGGSVAHVRQNHRMTFLLLMATSSRYPTK